MEVEVQLMDMLSLTPREQAVIALRDATPKRKFCEIAHELGVNKAYAQQIDRRARNKLEYRNRQIAIDTPQTVKEALDWKRSVLKPATYLAVCRAFYTFMHPLKKHVSDDSYEFFLEILHGDELLRERSIGVARLAELRRVFL